MVLELIFEEEELERLWKATRQKQKQIYAEEFQKSRSTKQYFKYVDGWTPRQEAVVRMIHQNTWSTTFVSNYVVDPEKTSGGSFLFDSNGINVAEDKIKQTSKFWNQRNKELFEEDLERVKERVQKNLKPKKNKPRYTTHIVLSMEHEPDNKSIRAITKAVRDVQFKHFTTQGFDTFFTIHDNTDNVHAHLVVHNRNLLDDQKINCTKQMTYCVRKDFADSLSAQGYKYVATLKNHDSLKAKSDKTLKQKAKRDYFTNEMIKVFGEEVRPYLKKLMIESESKNQKKSERAKENLKLCRKALKNTNEKEIIERKLKVYLSQREKYEAKKRLVRKFPEIDEKAIGSYVDTLYAKQKKALIAAKTRLPESMVRLSKADKAVSDLYNTKAETLKKFSQKKKVSVDRELGADQANSKYGIMGKELVPLLFKEYLSYDKEIARQPGNQRIEKKTIAAFDKIQSIIKGDIFVDEIRKDLVRRNTANISKNFRPRIHAIKEIIAEDNQTSRSEVDIQSMGYWYLIKKGRQPKTALKGFESLIRKYRKLLADGDPDKVEHFKQMIWKSIRMEPPRKRISPCKLQTPSKNLSLNKPKITRARKKGSLQM